jgi:RNA polymerase sigma-70 factor (ECF subfamily)
MNRSDFEAIFKTYREPIYRLCLGYFGGNQQQADDTCQEVFIKVWQNLDRFKGQSKVSTWIYRIAVNTCLNVIRSTAYKTQPMELTTDVAAEEQTDVAAEQLGAMYTCISALNPKDRSIILLVLDQNPYEEIAGIMGISENNLRVKIHRIKDKLSKCVNS